MRRNGITMMVVATVAVAGMLYLQGCAAPVATLVIGQPDFTSGAANQGKGQAANNTFNIPAGPVAVYHDALYVTDSWNNRLLVFSPIPTVSNASATGSIQSPGSATWLGFNHPYGLSIENDMLSVADMSNNRVLLWKKIPAANEAPDVVVGQSDMTTPPVGDCSHLNEPRAVALAGGKMIVSDWSNHRILIWNRIPAQTDAKNPIAADVILGNTDCTPDEKASTRHTFNQPRGVWSDGTRLVVADTDNHRVLIWLHFPTHAKDDADIVLGTGKPGASRTQLNGPYGVFSDGTKLFVSEMNNNRVLQWNKFPLRDGEAASAVFGQRDFERSGRNGAAREDAPALPPSASGLNQPQGVYFQDNRLWVTDTGNNRVLMFEVKK